MSAATYWRYRKILPPPITLPQIWPGETFGAAGRYRLERSGRLWMVVDLGLRRQAQVVRVAREREKVFEGLELLTPADIEMERQLFGDPNYIRECGLAMQAQWTERCSRWPEIYNFNQTGECRHCQIARPLNISGACEDCVTRNSFAEQLAEEGTAKVQ